MLRLFVLSVVLTVVLAAGVTAANEDVFRPVPRDHWAYDALVSLRDVPAFSAVLRAYDGGGPDPLVSGPPMNRYTLTVAVARAAQEMTEKGVECELTPGQLLTLSKLVKEFRAELALLGADVKALEKDLDARMKAAQPVGVLEQLDRDHWVYDALIGLRSAGIAMRLPMNCLGSDVLDGGRPLTRHECAVAVSSAATKITKEIALSKLTVSEMRRIIILVEEFRSELKSIGVDTDALEKDLREMSSRIEIIEYGRPRSKPEERYRNYLPLNHPAYRALKQLEADGLPVGPWSPPGTIGETTLAKGRPLTHYDDALATANLLMQLSEEDALPNLTPRQLVTIKRLLAMFKPDFELWGADTGSWSRELSARTSRIPELAEMPKDHWAGEAMQTMYDLGIFEGYPPANPTASPGRTHLD